jgi:ribonuclease P protein component
MGQFSLPKSERLSRNKSVKELFERGSSFYLYPFKVLYIDIDKPSQPNQVLVSVSKRNFKKAANRNLIKRRIREAYRLSKTTIMPDRTLQMAYIYVAKEVLPFEQIQKKMLEIIKRLNNHEK